MHDRKGAPLTQYCKPVAVQFLDFFLKGNLSLEAHPRRKPHDWLPKQGWQDLMKLTELAANKGSAGRCACTSRFHDWMHFGSMMISTAGNAVLQRQVGRT